MVKSLAYTHPHVLPALHDELVAAQIRPSYLGTQPGTTDGIEMAVADDVAEASVEAVVAAHDPVAIAAQQQAAVQSVLTDAANVRAFMRAANNTITLPLLVVAVKSIVRVVARRFTELAD